MNYFEFKKSLEVAEVHGAFPENKILDFECEIDEPIYALKTSGSTGQKIFLHRLSGIKSAVNSFLKVFSLGSEDRWGFSFSTEHVSGFSVFARSHFGGLKAPLEFKWSAQNLEGVIKENQITVLSLVPTQIFDLVESKIKAPKDLKHVFVGGAALSKPLMDEAKKLGWPLVLCYGSTETFAQMSYSFEFGRLKTFPGWTAASDPSGELSVKGPGLYWAQLDSSGKVLIRRGDWFKTGDRGAVETEKEPCTEFTLEGRMGNQIKIKGAYFDFGEFKKNFSNLLEEEGLSAKSFFPVVLEEERNGAGVYLMCAGPLADADFLLQKESFFRGAFKISSDVFGVGEKVDKLKLEDVLLRTVVSL